jgi:hypothetical protein
MKVLVSGGRPAGRVQECFVLGRGVFGLLLSSHVAEPIDHRAGDEGEEADPDQQEAEQMPWRNLGKDGRSGWRAKKGNCGHFEPK